MAPSPVNMYADLLRRDLSAFIHRSFLELNAQTRFLANWHIEVLAAKLEEVRRGHCKRLIINVPPRHLKSHATSIAFPAWVLGHEPAKQILLITYAQDLSDSLARSAPRPVRTPRPQEPLCSRAPMVALSDGRSSAASSPLQSSTTWSPSPTSI